MKHYSFFTKLIASSGIAATIAGLAMASNVYAATPTISFSSVGGDSVQVSVIGDPNEPVMFYYNVGSSSGMQETTLGDTNSSGSFSSTISATSYGILSGDNAYVVVNGQQSSMIAWPVTSESGTPVLSQSTVTLGLGQSITVVAEGGSNVYMASDSSSNVANISTNGSQITVTGEQIGGTVASICYVGTSSSCTTLSVNVQSTSVSTLSFSQNNFSIVTGNNQAVVISGGSGVYTVSGNSNTSIASTNLSSNVVTVYGLAAGTDTITVCDQSGNCAALFVTISTTTSNGSVVFGETNPTLTTGQNINIGLSGGSTYYISSNPSAGIAQATVTGNTLAIYGENVGSDQIIVCSSNGGCNTLYVTVTSTSVTTQTTSASNSTALAEIQTLETAVTQALAQLNTIQTQLSLLTNQINSGSVALDTTTTTNSASTTSSASSYTFTEFLSMGTEDAEVTALQQRLTSLGFYSGPITGFYGSLTEQAVAKYQTAHGIDPAGYVGPSTRAALNG